MTLNNLLELKKMNWAKRACMLHVNVNREQGQDNLETCTLLIVEQRWWRVLNFAWSIYPQVPT